jgi:hypothetical protein
LGLSVVFCPKVAVEIEKSNKKPSSSFCFIVSVFESYNLTLFGQFFNKFIWCGKKM